MKKAFLTLFLLIAFPVVASHIVGGEFELLHISGSRYRLNLIYYFDKNNGFKNPDGSQSEPELVDPNLTAHIYQKSNNALIRSVLLPFLSKSRVSYTQPSCSKGEIVTDKLIYSAEIELSSTTFNDPEGYYVSWQRCCRNYAIDNIYSPPQPNPPVLTTDRTKYAGQTFYLEFPPVTKDGLPFINSSPKLFPPLNDYACSFKPYYVDFAGVDDDKDSLVYSLITPLTTISNQAVPPSAPTPYPEVLWKSPFSLTNLINGSPDLRITKDGLLTCTARIQGLFVFAVKVDEFRKGLKIGESRRDFQMLVVDCPVASPPQITGKKLTDGDFKYSKNMSVSFDNTVADGDRCINVRVSDLDSTKPDQNFTENIGIRIVGLNFKNPNLNQVLPAVTTATLTNGSTKDFTICFPQCPYINGPYQVGIIAYDDACSLPLLDTLKIIVNVEPPPNARARFTKPSTKLVTQSIDEGSGIYSWDIEGVDADNDDLLLSFTTDGFVLAERGFTLAPIVQQPGLLRTRLTWDPKCEVYDFTKKNRFKFKFLLDDIDKPCNLNLPDTLLFDLRITNFPKNSDPTISTEGLAAPASARKIKIEHKVFDQVNFKVKGSDVDNDFLVLSGKGVGFDLSDYGITFPQVSGKGNIFSNFLWNIKCDKIDLKKKDTYTFQFIVLDNMNKCHFYKTDTVEVEINLKTPDNAKPSLTAYDLAKKSITNSSPEYILGQPIEFNLLGLDADLLPAKDNLMLKLIDAKGAVTPTGFTFSDIKGVSGLQSLFSWSPDCSIFKDGVYANNYTFRFSLSDDRCLNAKADTIAINLKISDVNGSEKAVYLPNVFTPNGDTFNDYFALEGIESKEGFNFDELVALPKENCVQHFESVKIFNRWGDLVFESTDRKFRWHAPQESAGVYYYVVKYNNKEYKSPLSVRY